MKWLGSLDALLYEVMSWLLFFPLTLWRATVQPLAIMDLVEHEGALPEDEQYATILSPPLFLALALLLAHTVATALGQTDAIIASHHGLAGLVNDNASALVLRVVVFAAFPLFLAARLVRGNNLSLDRTTLRRPFYEQCYPAAVFALGVSIGTSLAIMPNVPTHMLGRVLIVLSVGNFWVVETRWFARATVSGYGRAAGSVLLGMLQGALFLLAVGFLFSR